MGCEVCYLMDMSIEFDIFIVATRPTYSDFSYVLL
jgi:hypothetical protein